jgi:EAL domain-containing protein (putative c-di-GMP-specific phosphodiesterase class I)
LVDVEDLSVIGLEALVRWNHPRHGLSLPSMFLPFARQTGLISAVDEWVAGAMARQRHAWHAQGLDPYVGFNLDPQYGRRPRALESLLERVDEGALDVAHLTIGLSECVSLRDDDDLLAFVWGLHAAGITVSLDDFGRAYSSLNRLRELRMRWVKLDRMILQGVPEDPTAANVLEAAIDLMRALQLEFIVEGVEHEEQRLFLQSLGVRIAQGYLLGRPVPAEDLYDRLRRSPVSQLVSNQQPAAGSVNTTDRNLAGHSS